MPLFFIIAIAAGAFTVGATAVDSAKDLRHNHSRASAPMATTQAAAPAPMAKPAPAAPLRKCSKVVQDKCKQDK